MDGAGSMKRSTLPAGMATPRRRRRAKRGWGTAEPARCGSVAPTPDAPEGGAVGCGSQVPRDTGAKQRGGPDDPRLGRPARLPALRDDHLRVHADALVGRVLGADVLCLQGQGAAGARCPGEPDAPLRDVLGEAKGHVELPEERHPEDPQGAPVRVPVHRQKPEDARVLVRRVAHLAEEQPPRSSLLLGGAAQTEHVGLRRQPQPAAAQLELQVREVSEVRAVLVQLRQEVGEALQRVAGPGDQRGAAVQNRRAAPAAQQRARGLPPLSLEADVWQQVPHADRPVVPADHAQGGGTGLLRGGHAAAPGEPPGGSRGASQADGVLGDAQVLQQRPPGPLGAVPLGTDANDGVEACVLQDGHVVLQDLVDRLVLGNQRADLDHLRPQGGLCGPRAEAVLHDVSAVRVEGRRGAGVVDGTPALRAPG
mmetsp:Transcript_58824/g.157235  ORF Transcript_58824/g.157235 Transcript_58824/m.157235 type:complete len:424 (-) Transcript_58824:262-1533(-)